MTDRAAYLPRLEAAAAEAWRQYQEAAVVHVAECYSARNDAERWEAWVRLQAARDQWSRCWDDLDTVRAEEGTR